MLFNFISEEIGIFIFMQCKYFFFFPSVEEKVIQYSFFFSAL